MSEATIRAQIKALAETISGIGQVHDYKRHSRSIATWLALVRSSGTVNAVIISRRKTEAERLTMPFIKRSHHFELVFIHDIDDENASEKTFQAMLESAFDTFKSQQTLNDTCINVDPLQIVAVDEDDFQTGTLYHVAECLLIWKN